MADVNQNQFTLMSLEDELTCSICLSTFNCPVTLPCGHNFCQDCLLTHWKDSYSCPQCRTSFPTKPELKKNTVLSTVVKTFHSGCHESGDQEIIDETTEETLEEKKDEIIRCDTCMDAEASQTCLTCMASYCEEHLRPHRENPKFSVHQLCEPIEDLSEHICADHNKLMEFFCSEHGRPICSLCLQQVHKGCPFISPEEQRNQKELDFREKLSLLDMKIDKTETVLFQMKDMQSKLKDASTFKKTALAGLYQQMQDILAAEGREAQNEVERELEMVPESGLSIGAMMSLKSEKASFHLPKVVNFDPHPPRINLDSKKVTATQTFAATLKEHLTEILKQPVEARLQTLKPDEKAEPAVGPEKSLSITPEPDPHEQRRPPRSHSPGCPPVQPIFQPVPVPVYISPQTGWNPSQFSQSSGFHKRPHFNPGQKPNKKSDASPRPFHKQENKPQGAHGGGKPSAKGSDSSKRDHPHGHPPSGKSSKGNPHPKNKK
ncbi:E3 ubiquitin/ISG15 ligase TRIM25-like [Xyrichtys novacula]|uniref:E3 ubiquitin/ISG15 ligase TRIM25-like n=1 Tax=Xyrichtys novacula TaxID=13765 RepID=A0AAV1EXG0_XYRNO|nr:E3 ubiquitin/ISG15 ligase TRIM25-like [Xyrichtys novacula]